MSKGQPAGELPTGAGSAGGVLQAGSDQDGFQQRHYDMLTDTWNQLKRRAEMLRENEWLKNETEQTTTESEEYVSFVSRKTEILQNAIETLNEQSRQEVERLRKQREAELQKHTEKVNELKRRILEKESEICHLKAEIAELSEFKNQHQQQQLGRISELQGQLEAMYCSHAKEVRVQMADCHSKKAQYEKQARQAVEDFTRAANREAIRSMMAQIQQVSQENQSLQGELQQLIQRTHVLRSRRGQLQAHRQQLLLEKECGRVVRRQRARPEEGSDVPPGQ
ncbi:coiled-coil domain-containing protein 166 isoform X2 [Brienomyrus brachyistius]|uniref:coiled-coil domain-containing protein 166 isoform X2 n=1 Tax=Brienomyrus brachyistius TaxID=42636 RepID=UPI0020B34FA0|nr:coiled-coil domain-containing protein 166 isoform X2 [Brienomyrus brachyistius]